MTSTRLAAATGLPISRNFLEETIDALIDLLDQVDPDPDLEPSLGAATRTAGCDAEFDEAEPGVGDLDGLWEQGHLAGCGLELLAEERREARAAAKRAIDLVARIAGREAASVVRS